MKWIATGGNLSIKDGVATMESTETSTLQLSFDTGLELLDFINNFIIPVSKNYGIDITVTKRSVKEKRLTEAKTTVD
ncbi:MAG: hypothetical protein QW046_03210 [Candidatus Micrarchaeaceae archaeon]